MKIMRALPVFLAALFLIALLASPHARAQTHMAAGQRLMPQLLVTHADTAISAAASPTALPTPADASKIVNWICQNTGATNSARVGPSAAGTGASTGISLLPCSASACVPVVLSYNGALYAYSASGTSVACNEVDAP